MACLSHSLTLTIAQYISSLEGSCCVYVVSSLRCTRNGLSSFALRYVSSVLRTKEKSVFIALFSHSGKVILVSHQLVRRAIEIGRVASQDREKETVKIINISIYKTSFPLQNRALFSISPILCNVRRADRLRCLLIASRGSSPRGRIGAWRRVREREENEMKTMKF
jgi:hypothetical protein